MSSAGVLLSTGGSPPAEAPLGWQAIFVSLGGIVILLEMVRGWRLGLMRQLVRVIAVLAAYGCAMFAGGMVLPVTRSLFKMPDSLLTIIGGVLLSFLAYAVTTSLGTIFFKRTSQHEARTVRMIWGSSGALLGVLFGLFFAWMAFAGVRLIGSVAEAQVHSREGLTTATTQPIWNRPLRIQGKPARRDEDAAALVSTLAQMKTALESGPLGETVKKADPLPATTYRTLEKLGAVASDVATAERFLAFPGARDITAHPKIVALRNDPEIADLVAHGRIFDLLQNERIIAAANDPTLRGRIKKFDLERALDYALKQ